ncbi:hypothetical protein F2Q68_00043157 [Brassica cretica]|uniref:Uncharacterized protein n=1 Tax=Brassica cretica TaxID=69181 RepID=A0A8S9LHB9_BRACR|nr:hypothetical protein F2Q68_00043157 [Brassica cretica]
MSCEFSESKDGVVSLATFPDIHPDSREELFVPRIHPSSMSQPLPAYLRRRSQLQHWITEFSKSSDDRTLQNHQPLFHHLIHPFHNNHQLDYLQAPEHLISDKAVVESRDTRDGVQHENEITSKCSGHVICEFSESKDGVVSLATFPDIHPDSREELFGQRIHPSCMSQPLSAYLRRRSQLQHWITEFSKSSDDKTLQNHQPLFHHLIHPFQNNHQLDYLQAPEHLISDKVRLHI